MPARIRFNLTDSMPTQHILQYERAGRHCLSNALHDVFSSHEYSEVRKDAEGYYRTNIEASVVALEASERTIQTNHKGGYLNRKTASMKVLSGMCWRISLP